MQSIRANQACCVGAACAAAAAAAFTAAVPQDNLDALHSGEQHTAHRRKVSTGGQH